ncbi:SdpA family antimicrobial peptide system protein [Staphylococcus haemolyticus]|uniref:SdpA family antimicrobial peptide system protein n=1 Tax=Staphylococcus haemolyticus TaxID=1283 RepID=UPI001C1F1A60|nr:SdpA family antimicrobial peptide system protein [Staphylococcus haemolyticus]MBU6949656.1 SdpA family antimicrobial peptide system protein [Staphylococcus haemolyticus]MBU7213454.1 SdpA family antimicrobial peptide system protein [Staphylococcus haemolyticus]
MVKPRVIFLLSIFIIGSIFATSVLIGIAKNNPITTFSKDTQVKIGAIWPQGWGFFSKNPRSTNMKFYSLENSEEVRLPNMKFENVFGLNRKGRAQAIEAGRLNSKIPKHKWKTCENSSCNIKNIATSEKSFRVKNDAPKPLLKGEYIFVQQKPIPWNYSKYYKKKTEIKKYIKVKVE